MAKRRAKRSGSAPASRHRLSSKRGSRLPVIVLTVVTAIAALALVIFGFLNSSTSH